MNLDFSIKDKNSLIEPIKEYIQFYEPEVYIDISNNIIENIKPYYKISTYGNIYSKLNNKILIPRLVGHGYLIITLQTENGAKDFLIHRLVKMCFTPVENMDELQVNHRDCIITNNYIENLEWCTNEYNNLYKIAMNERRMFMFYNYGYNTLTDNELKIISICEMLEKDISYENIGKFVFGYYDDKIRSIITAIKIGNNWKYISKFYNVQSKFNARTKFNNEQVMQICKLFTEGKSNSECLKILNFEVNKSNLETIRRIRYRERYSNITLNYIW